ncbi:hypothetical protein MNEG_12981, partial [Monoraphidium neglectum]
MAPGLAAAAPALQHPPARHGLLLRLPSQPNLQAPFSPAGGVFELELDSRHSKALGGGGPSDAAAPWPPGGPGLARRLGQAAAGAAEGSALQRLLLLTRGGSPFACE